MYNTYHQRSMTGPLRSVMLGTFFYPEFFSTVKSSKIREPLMRVAHEIQEDLDNFENTLKRNNINVIRSVQPNFKFGELDHNINSLAVRNSHVVVGDKLLQLDKNSYVLPELEKYCNNILDLSDSNEEYYKSEMFKSEHNWNREKNILYSQRKYKEISGSSWPDYSDYVNGNWQVSDQIFEEINSFKESLEYYTPELGPLEAPNVIGLDDKILVDANEYVDYSQWLKQNIIDDRPVEQITTKAGHTDGVFMFLNSNTVLGIKEILEYLNFDKNKNIIAVPESAYQNHIHEFKLMKEKVNGKWWIPGQEENQELIEFTEQVLGSWIGKAEESVFDINLLVLDEHTVMVNRIDDIVVPNLTKNKIDCILVPWRHRFFVDDGLHCITLDLYRD